MGDRPPVDHYDERSEPGGLTRRRFLRSLAGAAAGVVAVAVGVRLSQGGGNTSPTVTSPGGTASTTQGASSTSAPTTTVAEADIPSFALADYADNIQRGGPPKDGIPPIDKPVFAPAGEVDFLNDVDVVFGLSHEGVARAYPQLILVWHEIVNDLYPDGPLTVTYCPLTGSTVGFRGTSPTGDMLTFGTSGNLVNSNLLMYDRQTDSNWPQILGTAINGPAEGTVLEEIPVVWTTWGRWRERFPDSEVLTTDTGHVRSYGSDPYGSYTPLGGYYQPESRAPFPIMWSGDRFPAKEVFIGVKHGESRLAVRKSTLRERLVASAMLEDDPVVVLYNPALDEGRAFPGPEWWPSSPARAGGRPGRLRRSGDGRRLGRHRYTRRGSRPSPVAGLL